MAKTKTEKKKKWEYNHRTDEELKKIAMDLVDGLIFSNLHCYDEISVRQVFMPLMFMDKKELKKMLDWKITMIYEYMKEAGPIGCNGNPSFFSMCLLDKEDHRKMTVFYKSYKKMKEEFKKEGKDNGKKENNKEEEN